MLVSILHVVDGMSFVLEMKTNNEIKRMIHSMPNWIPGEYEVSKVNTRMFTCKNRFKITLLRTMV